MEVKEIVIYLLIAGGFYMQWKSLQNCMNKTRHDDEYEPRARDQ